MSPEAGGFGPKHPVPLGCELDLWQRLRNTNCVAVSSIFRGTWANSEEGLEAELARVLPIIEMGLPLDVRGAGRAGLGPVAKSVEVGQGRAALGLSMMVKSCR